MANNLRESFDRMKQRRPRTMDLAESPVRFGWLDPESRLLRLATPGVPDLNLVAWAGEHRALVEDELARSGGILFRDFAVRTPEQFETLCAALSPELMDYSERSTVRTEVGGKVYTSTEFPADQTIPLHNELSYGHVWPQRIWFFCHQPPAAGGETPIADSREVYRRIDPEVRRRFVDRGVMYVRNYGPGLGLPWQEVFQTEEPAAVDDFCREAGIEARWTDDGRLRTRVTRQAVARHPRTGETVWFNQANVHHVLSLPADLREPLLKELAQDELPFNTFYGDGAPISQQDLEAIHRAYRESTFQFSWQRGDIMMLDNLLIAHGRNPFEGERRILVAMA